MYCPFLLSMLKPQCQAKSYSGTASFSVPNDTKSSHLLGKLLVTNLTYFTKEHYMSVVRIQLFVLKFPLYNSEQQDNHRSV